MRRRRRLVQIVYDLASQPWDRLRILDLGSLDGSIAFEFARRGAEVVGIEVRAASVLAARAEQERLKIKNVTFFQDDVRNLSKQKYGTFDIVHPGHLRHMQYAKWKSTSDSCHLWRTSPRCAPGLLSSTPTSRSARRPR